MGQQVIEHTVTTTATPAAVFALLRDGSTWPSWSPLGSFELIEPGQGRPEGLGAVRLFTTGRHTSRERVVIVEPDTTFSYVLEAGLPLRDYQAVITLVPRGGGGTSVTWCSTFVAKRPGTGWIYRRALGSFIEKTVVGLAEAAAAGVGPGSPAPAAASRL
jgi:hypothetical protein